MRKYLKLSLLSLEIAFIGAIPLTAVSCSCEDWGLKTPIPHGLNPWDLLKKPKPKDIFQAKEAISINRTKFIAPKYDLEKKNFQGTWQVWEYALNIPYLNLNKSQRIKAYQEIISYLETYKPIVAGIANKIKSSLGNSSQSATKTELQKFFLKKYNFSSPEQMDLLDNIYYNFIEKSMKLKNLKIIETDIRTLKNLQPQYFFSDREALIREDLNSLDYETKKKLPNIDTIMNYYKDLNAASGVEQIAFRHYLDADKHIIATIDALIPYLEFLIALEKLNFDAKKSLEEQIMPLKEQLKTVINAFKQNIYSLGNNIFIQLKNNVSSNPSDIQTQNYLFAKPVYDYFFSPFDTFELATELINSFLLPLTYLLNLSKENNADYLRVPLEKSAENGPVDIPLLDEYLFNLRDSNIGKYDYESKTFTGVKATPLKKFSTKNDALAKFEKWIAKFKEKYNIKYNSLQKA